MADALSRRRFLRTSALAGAGLGALLLPERKAAGFEIKPMDAQTHELYVNACGGSGISDYHRQLLAEAKSQLDGHMSAADEEAALAALSCPICGCRLAS